ncbi:hypothetical protein BDQ12DRAFT_268365 [Crucibulum laeve]|uniref:Uncharacterized protein n=1 Tax=Crucibulum laeve TaxID=68775 RepID=A0A5C3LG29_9AGAR|nr:hypothetical protein BDQ12DRAFT_268365 [Crucibulum laeve]
MSILAMSTLRPSSSSFPSRAPGVLFGYDREARPDLRGYCGSKWATVRELSVYRRNEQEYVRVRSSTGSAGSAGRLSIEVSGKCSTAPSRTSSVYSRTRLRLTKEIGGYARSSNDTVIARS